MLNTLFKYAVIAPVAAAFVPAPGASPVNAAQKHYEQERGKKKSAPAAFQAKQAEAGATPQRTLQFRHLET